MWKNDLTEKLKIKYPIIQAPMAGGATTPELIAAVSNAGALGALAAGYTPPADIQSAIRKIRQLTQHPFTANLFIPHDHQASAAHIKQACEAISACCPELHLKIEPQDPPFIPEFEEQLEILVQEKIPIFSFAFGSLAPKWLSALRKNKTTIIGTATTPEEALELEENGVDFIVAQGSEAGGHRASFFDNKEELIDLKSLLEQVKQKVKIPIIAAGGIMNGKQIRTYLKKGAIGVQMGTAFLTCTESGLSKEVKEYLLAQTQDNTVLTNVFSGKLARGLNNLFIERMHQQHPLILPYPIQNALTSIMRKEANRQHNLNFISLYAGQQVRLCRNISAQRLIELLILEAYGEL